MLHDITKKTYKKGDVIKLSIQGVDVEGKVIATTVANFVREYHVQFSDGSKRWFMDFDLKNLKN